MAYNNKLNQNIAKLFRSFQQWEIFPYGMFFEDDGAEVIFDRRYRPICRVFPDGRVEGVNPSQWINFTDQNWFYHSGNHPRNDKSTRAALLSLIEQLGLSAELMVRRELENVGHLPAHASREWKA